MFPGSEFYGIKEIILDYAKLPRFLPLPVAVQHGWQRFAHAFEASARPPEIWVWSPRLAKELEAFYPAKRIRIVGSFFYYLMEKMKAELPVKTAQGSICIPPHSSHLAKTEYSLERFIEFLDQMGSELKPITVMLYYLDMDECTVNMYEKAGFKVVSNGTLYDDNFLRNFITHVYDKKYCIYSDLGSGVLYASELGLVPVRIDVQSTVINRGNIHITNEMLSAVGRFDEEFVMTMNESKVKEEMGKQYVMTPQKMRWLIIRNYFKWSFMRVFVRRIRGLILGRMKRYYQRQEFFPGLLGIFMNPYYFARAGLCRAMTELAPKLSGRLLDVGCGSKPYRLLFKVDEYVGLDIDSESSRLRGTAEYLYDGTIFPFENASFDSILCNQVLEHVFNPDEFLGEIQRVLKPGGKLLLTVPFVWDEHEQPHDFVRYSTFGLRALFEKQDLRIIEHRKLGADTSILFQLANAYLFKVAQGLPRRLNFLLTITVMAFINLFGLLARRLLPENPDLFLDHVVLAEKTR